MESKNIIITVVIILALAGIIIYSLLTRNPGEVAITPITTEETANIEEAGFKIEAPEITDKIDDILAALDKEIADEESLLFEADESTSTLSVGDQAIEDISQPSQDEL